MKHSAKKFIATAATAATVLLYSGTAAEAAGISIQSCAISTDYNISARTAGWMPTNTYSTWATAPVTITYSKTTETSTNATYSGSVSVSLSALAVEATATYGYAYSATSSFSEAWSYSAPAPSGVRGRMLILRAADKLSFSKTVYNANCTTTVTSGLIAYVPRGIDDAINTCIILDVEPAKTTWSSTCRD